MKLIGVQSDIKIVESKCVLMSSSSNLIHLTSRSEVCKSNLQWRAFENKQSPVHVVNSYYSRGSGRY